MNSLFELVLSHNFIMELPHSIGLLRNLRTLYLDENELTSLPPDVSYFTLHSLIIKISTIFHLFKFKKYILDRKLYIDNGAFAAW